MATTFRDAAYAIARRRGRGMTPEPTTTTIQRADTGDEPLRVLVLSSVFPSRVRPTYGVFVRERMRHVASHCQILVVAPMPWFPFNRLIRGRELASVPLLETQDGIIVYHPRFVCVPGVAKSLDGLLCFLSLLPFLAWLKRRFPFQLI